MAEFLSQADVHAGWSRKPRVFVVDDERMIADTLATILRVNGFDAVALYTAPAALDRLAEDDFPDLMVTDVALNPDSINGIDLAIYYERECPECKVVLISGHAETAGLHARARAAGYDFPLLQKPIRPERFLETVTGMLEHLRVGEQELRRAS